MADAGFSDRQIRQHLVQCGWSLFPHRACTEAVLGPTAAQIPPGAHLWAVVATKTKPVMMLVAGEERHGICHRQWWYYRHLARDAGIAVWLFLWERQNQVLCIAPFHLLGTPVSYSKEHARFCTHGLVFFPRHRFSCLDLPEFLAGPWNDAWMAQYGGAGAEQPRQQSSGPLQGDLFASVSTKEKL